MRPLFKTFPQFRYFKLQLITIISTVLCTSVTIAANPNPPKQYGSVQSSLSLPYSSSTYLVNGKSEQTNEEGKIILEKSHITISSADYQERFNIRSVNTNGNPIILTAYNSRNSNARFKIYFDALASLKGIKAELPSKNINFILKPQNFLFPEIKLLYSRSNTTNRQSTQTNPEQPDLSFLKPENFNINTIKAGKALEPVPSKIDVSKYEKDLGNTLDVYPDLDKALEKAKAKKREETLKTVIPIVAIAIALLLILLIYQLKNSWRN